MLLSCLLIELLFGIFGLFLFRYFWIGLEHVVGVWDHVFLSTLVPFIVFGNLFNEEYRILGVTNLWEVNWHVNLLVVVGLLGNLRIVGFGIQFIGFSGKFPVDCGSSIEKLVKRRNSRNCIDRHSQYFGFENILSLIFEKSEKWKFSWLVATSKFMRKIETVLMLNWVGSREFFKFYWSDQLSAKCLVKIVLNASLEVWSLIQ